MARRRLYNGETWEDYLVERIDAKASVMKHVGRIISLPDNLFEAYYLMELRSEMFGLEKLSLRDAAGVAGVATTTISSRLFAAKRRLRISYFSNG